MRKLADKLEALWNRSTPGRWAVYSSNSWRRIGMEGPFKEIIYPVRHAGDGHPDLSGPNVDADLALLTALHNAVPEILKALRAEALPKESALLEALRPLAMLGGPDDGCAAAFHDLEDDVAIYVNSGRGITAGDVRRARKLVSQYVQPIATANGVRSPQQERSGG